MDLQICLIEYCICKLELHMQIEITGWVCKFASPLLCQIWKVQQSPQFGFLQYMKVCLQICGDYIVYNDTRLTLQGLTQACQDARSDLGLQLQVRFDSYFAQLSLQCLCTPQQDLPFGDMSLTVVTRHCVIVFPASWSTSFGFATWHWLSKVDSISQFRHREAPLLLYIRVNPACCFC